MGIRVLVKVSAVATALAFSACSSKDDDGGGLKPTVDVSGFKNTTDRAGFNKKAGKASSFIDDAKNLRRQYSSGSGNGLVQRTTLSLVENNSPESEPYDCVFIKREHRTIENESVEVDVEECKVNQSGGSTLTCTKESWDTMDGAAHEQVTCENHSTGTQTDIVQNGALGDFQMDFNEPTDCNAAFDDFDNLYERLKQQMQDLVAAINNQNSFGLSGTGVDDGLVLVATKEDEQSAVAYDYGTKEGAEGIQISGSISGGANDDMILIKQKYKMVLDMEKAFAPKMPNVGQDQPTHVEQTPINQDPNSVITINQNQHIAADLNQKVIELVMDGNMTMSNMTTDVSGFITVNAGDKKSVIQNVTMSGHNEGQSGSAKISTKAEQVSKDSIVFDATVASSEGGGKFGFKVTRQDNGQCVVSDYVNTVTK